jgi:type I restriction enzyme S subunit
MLDMEAIKSFSIDKSEWQKVKFGDVVFEPKESVKNPTAEGIQHVVGLEHIDSEDIHLRRSASIEESTTFTKKFSRGDVLFGRRRAYLKKAAKAEFEGICSGDITVMRSREESLSPELLPFIVNNNNFFDHAITHSAGGLSPRVKFKDLSKFEFWLPPKHQQETIIKLLLSVENLLQKNIALQNSSKLYKESLIEENLTSQSSGSVLNDYCDVGGIKIGPFGSLLHKADYLEEGIPVIMPADIKDGVIQEGTVARISPFKAEELKNYRLKENDVLFSRRGDLTKRAIVEKHQEGWICGTGSIRVRLKEDVDPQIVYFAVSSVSTNDWLLSSSVGTTMPNLNAGTIKKIPLHLPEGENAKGILSKVQTAISSAKQIEQHVFNNKKLKASIIHKVF